MAGGCGIKVFGGSSGRRFAERICRYLGIELGRSETLTFSDGNTFVRIEETVRDTDAYVVQTIGDRPNDDLVELLFWMDAFKRASANSVTAIIPFFSYAKGDKKDEPRVSIRARVCAECIELAGADRVVTMDLHSAQIQGFFKKPVDHLFALPIISEYVKRLGLEDLVVVSPDIGFAKQARNYAAYLGALVAIGDKIRTDHSERARVLDIIGEVKGRNALIVDDAAFSGGSLVQLAHLLKEQGARRVIAAVSHLAISEEGMKRLEASPIEKVIATDTIERECAAKSPIVEFVSVAPLFAEAIKRIHDRQSMTSLFDHLPPSVIESAIEWSKARL